MTFTTDRITIGVIFLIKYIPRHSFLDTTDIPILDNYALRGVNDDEEIWLNIVQKNIHQDLFGE